MRSTGAWSARVMSDKPDPSPRRNAPSGDVLSGLAAVAPLPLVVLNGSRRLLYVNAAATELFGCNTDPLLGMDLIDHVVPGERSDVASYFRSVLPGPGRRDREVQRPDGEQRFGTADDARAGQRVGGSSGHRVTTRRGTRVSATIPSTG